MTERHRTILEVAEALEARAAQYGGMVQWALKVSAAELRTLIRAEAPHIPLRFVCTCDRCVEVRTNA